jgi:hypothetical protein
MAIDRKNSLVSVGEKQFQNHKIAAYNIAAPCNETCPLYVDKDRYLAGEERKCGYQDDSMQCKVDQDFLEFRLSEIRSLAKEANLTNTTIQEVFDYVVPLYTYLAKLNRIAAAVTNPYYYNKGNVQKHPVFEDIQKTNDRIFKYRKEILGEKKDKKVKDVTPSASGDEVFNDFFESN